MKIIIYYLTAVMKTGSKSDSSSSVPKCIALCVNAFQEFLEGTDRTLNALGKINFFITNLSHHCCCLA